MNKPSPSHAYYMELARKVASMSSTCIRRQVGAIAIRNGTIVASGSNGPPHPIPACVPETCIRIVNNIKSGAEPQLCRAIHAEVRMAVSAEESITNTDVYVTTRPCTECLKVLMGEGVNSITWDEDYDQQHEFFTILCDHYGDFIVEDGYRRLIKRSPE